MDPSEIEFSFLKANLGFMEPDVDTALYMKHLIDAARLSLVADGINLVETDPDDVCLIVMYAAWLYRKRDSGDAKPEMLRIGINNRKTRIRRTTT